MRVKRMIVVGLEGLCEHCHWFTHRRPWLWLPVRNAWCLPATWSMTLDERWNTDVWRPSPPST